MLNNTEYKSELSYLHEVIEDQPVTGLSVTSRAAANAPQFNHLDSAERRMRRERRSRRNTGFTSGGWRLRLW